MSDRVNSPSHYNQGNVQCIDAIKAALGPAFADYCIGNVIKYVWRWKHKGGVEDLQKAMVYLSWAVGAGLEEEVQSGQMFSGKDGQGYYKDGSSDNNQDRR